MADCVICGQPAGFMQHLHPECEHKRQAELDPLAAQKAAAIKASSTPAPEQTVIPAFCGQCGAKVEGAMKFCSGCGTALTAVPAAVASAAPTKKKTPLAIWIVGVPVALVLLMFALASTVPEKRARELEAQRRVKAECEKWMSDAQLGDERRMTRQICEQMQSGR